MKDFRTRTQHKKTFSAEICANFLARHKINLPPTTQLKTRFSHYRCKQKSEAKCKLSMKINEYLHQRCGIMLPHAQNSHLQNNRIHNENKKKYRNIERLFKNNKKHTYIIHIMIS